MYPYGERIRAVELDVKLGDRVAATIHQLVYPTENTLKNWCRECERCLDLPRGRERWRPKYSQAQIQMQMQMKLAVEHHLDGLGGDGGQN